MLIVGIFNAVLTKICLICEEHCWDENGLAVCLTIEKQNLSPVEYQQVLDPANVADIKGTAAFNGIPCKR